MQSKPTKETLMCTLTDQERREYGIQLATTLGDMENVEAEKKKEMDHFKDRLGGLQARADELSRKVRDGKEWRTVDCVIRYSQPDDDHKQVIRLDTGEVVRTALMTQEDRQLVMPLDDDDDGKITPMKVLTDAMEPGDTLEVNGEVVYQASEEDEEQDGPVIGDADDGADAVYNEAVESAAKVLAGKSNTEKKKRALDGLWKTGGLAGLKAVKGHDLASRFDSEIASYLDDIIADHEMADAAQSEPEGASDY